MPIVKVKLDAPLQPGDHDLDIPGVIPEKEVNEKYMPKEAFTTELDSRVKSITKGLVKPEDLLNVKPEDDFFKRFVETKKEDLTKVLNIQLDPKKDVDVEKIKGEAVEGVRRTELVPLQNTIKSKDEELDVLRGRSLDAQVSAAAMDLGIVPDLRELVTMHVKSKFAYDPERKEWFQRKENGEEGYELSSDPTKGGAPYVKAKEYLEKLSRDPSKKAWFLDTKQPGADYRGGKGGSAKQMTLEQYNKLPPAEKTKWAQEFPTEFRALMDQLRTQGESKLYA